jgi:glycosyltransferase involved in cell wall biosynthesis
LHAWNEIKDHFKETWLMIVGTSGNVFKHVDLTHEIERVYFLGYVDDKSLAGLYANAISCILPSQDEGFGLPALEAMASGTPVIASDGGALPEVLGEAGLTFGLSNPTGLTNSLIESLSNPELRATLREKGLERARSFSWQATAELVWNNLHEA